LPPKFLDSMKRHALALLAVLTLSASAENWPQWRGPNFAGTAPGKELPTTFSATEGVKWAVDLPGISGATPIIWGDRIFVMSPDAKRDQWLMCFARKDGALLWKQLLAGGMLDHGRGNSTSPSPVTDGKLVWALVGTGQLAAFDLDGKPAWKRDLGADYGKFNIMWTYGSSPLLFDGKLYVQVLQRSPGEEGYPGVTDKQDRDSYLLALEPATGKTLWKQVRPTDALKESRESYATPVPHVVGGKKQLLVAGGDVLTGHDAETGAELWRGGGINKDKGKGGGEWMRVVASPVSAGDLAFVCGPKNSAAIAYKSDGKGDVTESGQAWVFNERKTPDCCTPAYQDGKLYVLDGDAQVMTCLDAKTGAKAWQAPFALKDNRGKETFRSSPTLADGKLYSLGERGTVVVQSAADGAVLNVAKMMQTGEGARSSIAVSDGQLFIRTTEKLYCIGK
jgi:outer membrane protein assembly factor BamB